MVSERLKCYLCGRYLLNSEIEKYRRKHIGWIMTTMMGPEPRPVCWKCEQKPIKEGV